MDVLIRAAEARDFPRLTAIFDHPDVVIHSSQHPFLGEAKVTALLRDREDLVLLVAECEGEVQGYIGKLVVTGLKASVSSCGTITTTKPNSPIMARIFNTLSH